MPMRRNTPEDVWKRVDRRGPNECWPWTRPTNTDGYGQMRLDGHQVLGHRLVFELSTGIAPGSLLVCHTCDTPPCCNPAHLFLGTNEDNLRDCSAKGRTSRGASHVHAKLTPDQVREMRALHEAGATFAKLGDTYGVTAENVSFICRRETWRHVS